MQNDAYPDFFCTFEGTELIIFAHLEATIKKCCTYYSSLEKL